MSTALVSDPVSAENISAFSRRLSSAVISKTADPAANILISPINVLMCLAMAAQGSGGKTREEMAKVLFSCAPGELDQRIASFAKLGRSVLNVAERSPAKIHTANGLWVNSNHTKGVRESFQRSVEGNFNFGIKNKPFDGVLVAEINQWANDNTNGLIPNITNRLSPDSFMFLASALYFKAPWLREFDERKTLKRDFRTDGKLTHQIKLMEREFADRPYTKGRDYERITLPYKTNGYGEYTDIVLVRPTKKDLSAAEWLANNAPKDWLEGFGGEEDVDALVRVPHLSVKERTDLIPALKSLGLSEAFTMQANFDPMRDPALESEEARKLPTLIDFVQHDTVFLANEKYSEGAAITSGGVKFGYCPSPPPPKRKHIEFFLDRSFAMAVRYTPDHRFIKPTPLFISAINKPVADMGRGTTEVDKPKAFWSLSGLLAPK